MSSPVLAPQERLDAFRLVAQNLQATPEAIRNAGLTPVGEQPTNTEPEASYWNRVANYMHPFVKCIGPAHLQAQQTLESAGYTHEQTETILGGGFSTGTLVTAHFLGRAVTACCAPEARKIIREPQLDIIKGVLARSFPTLAKFSATKQAFNRDLEKLYNIRPYLEEASLYTNGSFAIRGFSLQQLTNGTTRVTPDNWEQSCMDVTRQPDLAGAKRALFIGTSRCPALTILTPALYHWMVDFGCATEEIAPTIIQDELAAQPSNVLAKQ